MSVYSPKRVLFAALAAVLFAVTAFASNPSPRNHGRMAFDAEAGELILFGGTSAFDAGTARGYESDETWAWTGTRWAQRYPAHRPAPRAAHAMAYDSTRGRIVVFGGRQQLGTPTGEIKVLDDTWVYENGDWSQINTASFPPARQFAGMAYDSHRDRMVLYGGFGVGTDNLTSQEKSDTWEFDGTNWTKVGDEAVKVTRPTMAYDAARKQMIMLGVGAELKTLMYRFDPATSAWIQMTPEKLPDCANDSAMVYQSHNATLLSIGGVCTAGGTDKTWEWNGTTWTEIDTLDLTKGTGMSLGYDALRATTVMNGGSDIGATRPRSTTTIYRNRDWKFAVLNTRPSPRSLFAFTGDPATQSVWLVGGVNEYNDAYLTDVWGLRDGQWFTRAVKTPPATCDAPVSAFDSNRGKLVLVCWPLTQLEVEVFEFDGTTFTQMPTSKEKPDARRFASLVYDENLKKIVFFGGFDGADYRDDTWVWDGSNWAEISKNKPPNRALHAMWYDPLQKRTILYGGIGRDSIEEHVERFSDMWSFSGTGWTKLSPRTTPGEILGAQYAVEPTGKLLLFGGMKSELTDPDKETTRRQFYSNETWQWDGAASTWTKLAPATSPDPRQNGRLAYDPVSGRLVLYGGFAGFFFSETWEWTGSNWEVVSDRSSTRRRTVGTVVAPANPTDIGD